MLGWGSFLLGGDEGLGGSLSGLGGRIRGFEMDEEEEEEEEEEEPLLEGFPLSRLELRCCTLMLGAGGKGGGMVGLGARGALPEGGSGYEVGFPRVRWGEGEGEGLRLWFLNPLTGLGLREFFSS